MITMDIFNNDAFTVTTMLDDLEKQPFVPTGLASLVGFEPEPVSTDTVGVGMIQGQISLIRTTLRGAPIEAATPETKSAIQIKIPRIAKGDKLFIHELANTAPFRGEGDVETAARAVSRKQTRLITDVEYTLEYHMLGAINGIILDADGSTLLDINAAFGVSAPSAIDLDLDNATPVAGKLRRDIDNLIVTPIETASLAGNAPNFAIRAICGQNFWNYLVTHPDVEKTYLGWSAAMDLQKMPRYQPFHFGGVDWIRYRGNASVGVSSNQAKIFPTGVPEMWKHIMGPCNEMEETVNQMGRRYYPVLERDQSVKKQWVQPEIYSYPLMLNRRPDLVLIAQV